MSADTGTYSQRALNPAIPGQDIIRLFTVLAISEISFVLLYLEDFFLGHPSETLQYLFDLNAEANIPTWFSSSQLLVIGIIFLLIGRQMNQSKTGGRPFYFILGLAFMGLSADETAIIHERFNDGLAKFHLFPGFNDLHDGIWIFVYLSLAAAFGLCFYRCFVALFKTHRIGCSLILGGIGVYILGAAGLEILGYLYMLKAKQDVFYYLEVSAEEFLEMFGATLVLCGALLLYRANRQQPS